MKTWWLALDRKYTSFEEIKHRRVVAQGWPLLGDLRTLAPLASETANEGLFKSVIHQLATRAYPGDERAIAHAPEAMWTLMQVRSGDLLVGIEGRTVRGVCQVDRDAFASYWYDATGFYDYAQTVCRPVEWRDWDETLLGSPPEASRHGVMAIKGLQNESERVIEAWSQAVQIRKEKNGPG